MALLAGLLVHVALATELTSLAARDAVVSPSTVRVLTRRADAGCSRLVGARTSTLGP
ncbi:MAG TPA: hypothetical protein VLA55_09925 [Ornithinibacter sp.]|nr:hypothetical protein [Ornithinibacter sp.]